MYISEVRAINYAQSIGDEVAAMHISTKERPKRPRNPPGICRLLPKYHSEEYHYQLMRYHHPLARQVCQTNRPRS